MKPIVNSYFSGAGLMDYGLAKAGLEIQQSFELDPTACATARLNLKHEVLQCDITQKLVKAEKPCNVIVGTYPCTRYSTIADIHQTRTGDELYLHFFRHIAIARPEVYAVENVPGMKKFPIVMEAMTKLPDYYVSTFCPVETHTWLPQRRDRLILIGAKKNFLWREPQCARRVSLKEIFDEQATDVHVPDYVYTRLDGGYRDKPIISDPDKDDVAPTCVAHYSKDRGTRLIVDKRYPRGVRPYSVREWARLQGLPDTFQFEGTDNDAYRMIGNGVPVPLAEWLGGEINRYFKAL